MYDDFILHNLVSLLDYKDWITFEAACKSKRRDLAAFRSLTRYKMNPEVLNYWYTFNNLKKFYQYRPDLFSNGEKAQVVCSLSKNVNLNVWLHCSEGRYDSCMCLSIENQVNYTDVKYINNIKAFIISLFEDNYSLSIYSKEIKRFLHYNYPLEITKTTDTTIEIRGGKTHSVYDMYIFLYHILIAFPQESVVTIIEKFDVQHNRLGCDILRKIFS